MEVPARAGAGAVTLERVSGQAFAGLPLTAQACSRRALRPVSSDAF